MYDFVGWTDLMFVKTMQEHCRCMALHSTEQDVRNFICDHAIDMYLNAPMHIKMITLAHKNLMMIKNTINAAYGISGVYTVSLFPELPETHTCLNCGNINEFGVTEIDHIYCLKCGQDYNQPELNWFD